MTSAAILSAASSPPESGHEEREALVGVPVPDGSGAEDAGHALKQGVDEGLASVEIDVLEALDLH